MSREAARDEKFRNSTRVARTAILRANFTFDPLIRRTFTTSRCLNAYIADKPHPIIDHGAPSATIMTVARDY